MTNNSTNRPQQKVKGEDETKLGTFAGVFTPSILTILGIILFMRLGYIVGSAGLRQTLLILLIANVISILTSVSLSAIATNLTIRGGGDYYLISRTLGFEFGGALGLVLFLAQSVSVGFYCIGFGEVAANLLGLEGMSAQIIAVMAIGGLFILAWKGADLATRFQYGVMIIMCLALLSFFIGGFIHWDSSLLRINWEPSAQQPSFWILFAVFFPAATGFTQGVSMSGDLRDPGKSLPLGTFLAVGISILVYLAAAIVFAGSQSREILINDYQSMNHIAVVSLFITAGVIAATLSSAMASFLGAPRILQALAVDKVFPLLNPFSIGVGKSNNPQRAILLSAAIAVLTIGLGNLNAIARVVAMFFLISYGLLNYATYFEARAASPSFRPRFKWFHQRTSLAGAVICLIVMLAIDWKAGALAVAVMFILYQYLKATARQSRWADSRRSYHLQQVKEHLLNVSKELEHARDWRPQVLAYSDNQDRRQRLLVFSSWLVGNSGLTTLVRILAGRGPQQTHLKHEVEKELYQDIANSGVQAFPLVINAPSFEVGNPLLLQSFGIGPLRANTIVLNHHSTDTHHFFTEEHKSFSKNLRTALRLGYNLVLLDGQEQDWLILDEQPKDERRIDIWFRPGNNGDLMLLLGHLMTRSPFWQHAKLRVYMAQKDNNSEATHDTLTHELTQSRIEAEAVIVEDFNPSTIYHHSNDASLTLLPLILREGTIVGYASHTQDQQQEKLPRTALIYAGQQIDLDAEPETGAAGLLAEAEDSFQTAQQDVEKINKELEEFDTQLDETLGQLLTLQQSGDEEGSAKTYKELAEIRQQRDKATRRSAQAEAKLEREKHQLEQLREEHHLNEPEVTTEQEKVD